MGRGLGLRAGLGLGFTAGGEVLTGLARLTGLGFKSHFPVSKFEDSLPSKELHSECCFVGKRDKPQTKDFSFLFQVGDMVFINAGFVLGDVPFYEAFLVFE